MVFLASGFHPQPPPSTARIGGKSNSLLNIGRIGKINLRLKMYIIQHGLSKILTDIG